MSRRIRRSVSASSFGSQGPTAFPSSSSTRTRVVTRSCVSPAGACGSGRRTLPAGGVSRWEKSGSSPGRAFGSGTWRESAGRFGRSGWSFILYPVSEAFAGPSRFWAALHPWGRKDKRVSRFRPFSRSEVDAGGEGLELADPLLEIGQFDPLRHSACSRRRRLALGAELEPLQLEPALPAPQRGGQKDGEAGQSHGCHRDFAQLLCHDLPPCFVRQRRLSISRARLVFWVAT